MIFLSAPATRHLNPFSTHFTLTRSVTFRDRQPASVSRLKDPRNNGRLSRHVTPARSNFPSPTVSDLLLALIEGLQTFLDCFPLCFSLYR
ncbi:hypothetical protein NPIL_594821 [Nephila pilipes]|uniref:Uncharacterized protein n=1 Tax=Nephila pilipes TaxID=299642 RepID=A0A8X6P500_NEPPI|nr:hypothetical protein NPIL_594821 [Nephila pilipes]